MAIKTENKIWKEVELPPLGVNNIVQDDHVFTRKATLDLYSIKFILEDEDGNRQIKFHDNEILFINGTYAMEFLPK